MLNGLGIDFTITKLSEPVQAAIGSEALANRLPLHLK